MYTATFSSIAGGTINEFLHKGFLSPDSQLVNTISRSKNKNLIIEIKDLNGDPLSLNGPWELTKKPGKHNLRSPKTLEYLHEVFPNQYIKKTFVFYPDSYSIGVDIDVGEIKNLIYRDIKFSWNGGLAPTEKDTVDDMAYFKASIYQGKELEDLKVKAGKKETKKLIGSTDWGAIRTK